MQKFICIGRITKDIELNSTTNGIFVTRFNVAVNRRFRNEDGEQIADFINVVAWRGLAENISKYCKKGSKVCIVGELQNRSWETDDGTKKYITEIIASECEFLDNKAQTQTDENQLQPIEDSDLPF